MPMAASEPHSTTPAADDTPWLTRRLAAGDEAAFRGFHERYFDRLYRFVLVLAQGREPEAREALQETLLRVARYARPFADDQVFWCWLKRVARSAACDAGRKQHRYLSLLRNYALRWAAVESAGETDHDEELSERLEESLLALDPQDRHLIEGKYLRRASVRELAAQSGLTEKAVESRLLRLRRHLREQLLQHLHHP